MEQASNTTNNARRMKHYYNNREDVLRKTKQRRNDPANAEKREKANAYQLEYYYKNRDRIRAQAQQARATGESRQKYLEAQRRYNEAVRNGEIIPYEFLNPCTQRNCQGTLARILGKKAQQDPDTQREVMQRNIWLLEMHRIKMRNPDDIKRCNRTIAHLQAQIDAMDSTPNH